MRLCWLELRDFRNHHHTRVDPVADGLVVVVGANGEGKSNLLEGMYVLFTRSSFRVSSNAPMVRDGCGSAFARGEVEGEGGRTLVEIEIPQMGAARVHVNRSQVRRIRDLKRQVRAVVFAPEDLDVIRGDPSERRRFMDEALGALWPLKEGATTAYDRTLRQRNRLLKEWEGGGAPHELGAWDAELVETGCALMRLRAEAVERIAPAASAEFSKLAGYELECAYAPSVWGDDLEGAFRARLDERREDELVRRTSLVGPHRDGLELAVREMRARAFASHGEAWGAALCLRIALADAVADEVGERPVLILDDPFSALDPRRQREVAGRLGGRGQVVVSVADEAHVPANADEVWDVAGGTVTVRGGA